MEIRLLPYEDKTVYLSYPPKEGRIIIEISDADICLENPYAVIEELFHTLQWQSDPGWAKGNMEFEAKILESILQLAPNMEHIYFDDPNYYEPFYKFFSHPSQETYQEAVNMLRNPSVFIYPEDKFPIKGGYEELTKHIDMIYSKN